MITLTLTLTMLLALQQAPPPLLQQALKLEPGVRLLDPAKDLREYTRGDLEKFGYWPPWIVEDFDGDMRPDIAAVVVAVKPSGRAEFGVIALHSGNPKQIEWVIPLDADPINGVTKGPAANALVPLFCVECDSNTWFRWSGEEYEPELYAVGEKVDVGNETQADLTLFSAANLASKPVTTVPHCSTVVIQKVGGTADQRWYFVETPDGQRGWVPASATSADLCVG